MEPPGAAVGRELTRLDASRELFWSAAPVEGRLAAILGEAAVEEDREVELVGDTVRQRDGRRPGARLVARPNRDERNDIRSSDPGVGALVPPEVDQLGGAPDPSEKGFDEFVLVPTSV